MADAAFAFAGAAGGLSQTDWFGLGSGVAGTGGAMASYNLAGYMPAVQMRQNQIYQCKNYHLAWVTVARDDVRGMMQASTTRMTNYVLVGTLILQTAIGMLLQDNFGKDAPDFIVVAFWIATALSVMFFTSSVVYSVKGQNNAFLNTMRLLSWEIRPENPAAYDFDYMKLIGKFERHGWNEIFRVPGAHAKYEDDTAALAEVAAAEAAAAQKAEQLGYKVKGGWGHFGGKAGKQVPAAGPAPAATPQPFPVPKSTSPGGDQEKHAVLEELVPDTRDLLYLERFGKYMALWQTYDTHSKYCIGLGLICMSHSATFWCMGRLTTNSRNMSDFIAVIMMSIFEYMAYLVYHMSFTKSKGLMQAVMLALFLICPLFGLLGVVLRDRVWIQKLFRCLFMVSNSWLFMVGCIASVSESKRPSQVAEKYILGPAGQKFKAQRVADRRRRQLQHDGEDVSAKAHWDADLDSLDSDSSYSDSEDSEGDSPAGKGKSRSIFHAGSTTHASRRSVNNEDRTMDDQAAMQVHKKVSRTFRGQLLLAALLWMAATVQTALGQFSALGLCVQRWFREYVGSIEDLEEVPMAWPSRHFSPGGMACSRGQVFVANSFQVVQLNLTSGLSREYPCKGVNVTIKDLTLDCSAGGVCQPLVLLSDSRLVNCATGVQQRLLQNQEGAQKVSLLQGPMDTLENSSLMLLREGRFVQSEWSDSRQGWVPMWELGEFRTQVSEMLKGCSAGPSGELICSRRGGGGSSGSGSGGSAAGRRLRTIRRGNTGSSRTIHAGILQRGGRPLVDLGADSQNVEAATVDITFRNIDFTDDGLFVFSTATSKRGWIEYNLITLLSVPSMEMTQQSRLPKIPDTMAGCSIGDGEVLILQHPERPRLMRGSF